MPPTVATVGPGSRNKHVKERVVSNEKLVEMKVKHESVVKALKDRHAVALAAAAKKHEAAKAKVGDACKAAHAALCTATDALDMTTAATFDKTKGRLMSVIAKARVICAKHASTPVAAEAVEA